MEEVFCTSENLAKSRLKECNSPSFISPHFPMSCSKCPAGLVALVLVVVGALNWGLVGLGMLMGKGADWNVVHMILGQWMTVEAVVYLLVGLAGVYKLAICCKGCCGACKCGNTACNGACAAKCACGKPGCNGSCSVQK